MKRRTAWEDVNAIVNLLLIVGFIMICGLLIYLVVDKIFFHERPSSYLTCAKANENLKVEEVSIKGRTYKMIPPIEYSKGEEIVCWK